MRLRDGKRTGGANGESASATPGVRKGLDHYKKEYAQTTQNSTYKSAKEALNKVAVPFLLMSIMPNYVLALWFTCQRCDGSYSRFLGMIRDRGVLSVFGQIWGEIPIFSPFAIKVVAGYAVFALLLQRILPGSTFHGPTTPKGNVPVYRDNGFLQYLVTMACLWGLQWWLVQRGLSLSIIYDRYNEILVTLNIAALLLCLLIYFKGLYFPSSSDSGSTSNVVFDYYWGTELYPRVLGWDVKVFTNCRFGMMTWPMLINIYAIKSYELHGFVDSMFVSVAIQMVYLTKFYWWEAGYMSTIDIMQDRAGWYLCWGCLVYVPSFYTSVGMYLVTHPVQLGDTLAAVILVSGVICVAVNYWADYQKQAVRRADGRCSIWGRPAEIIRASYKLEGGKTKQSILLLTGFWGLARHFHYIPELGLAFCWSVPALFTNLFPFSYFLFLTILLTHRTFRDDVRCKRKYGPFWELYVQRVPNRMIPYVF